jgi:hypothetical protein
MGGLFDGDLGGHQVGGWSRFATTGGKNQQREGQQKDALHCCLLSQLLTTELKPLTTTMRDAKG